MLHFAFIFSHSCNQTDVWKTRDILKVYLPTYFCRNSHRYGEHNISIAERLGYKISPIGYALFLAGKNNCFILWVDRDALNMVSHSIFQCFTHCLTAHIVFCFQKWMSIGENVFYLEELLSTYFHGRCHFAQLLFVTRWGRE